MGKKVVWLAGKKEKEILVKFQVLTVAVQEPRRHSSYFPGICLKRLRENPENSQSG
jgi:hypothetical protein